MSPDWFATRQLEPGVFLVAEPVHVSSYLVVGSERAALIDTGLGIGDVRAAVERLTDRPVVVVNTHHHFDHVGGNHRFGDVRIHEAGAGLLGEEVPRSHLEAYLDWTRRMLEAWAELRRADEGTFAFVAEETTPRPLPASFDPSSWRIVPPAPTGLLREGDEVDLGDRALRVLHTPGHTPDSICLLDEASGALFAGDTVNTGPIYGHLPGSDVTVFARSTARLADLAGSVRAVYMAHYVRYHERPGYLREVADGFAAVLAGEASWRSAEDEAGRPVREARFARFSIYVGP